MTDDEKNAEVKRLNDRIAQLESAMTALAQANAVEHVISNGFAEISAQLGPLRELAPRYEKLSDEQLTLLKNVHTALARQEWRGSDFNKPPLEQPSPAYGRRAT